jgi:hypothetical protein
MRTNLPARRPSAVPSPGPDFRKAHAARERATKLADVVTIRDHARGGRVAYAKAMYTMGKR